MSDREAYCRGEPLRIGTEWVLLADETCVEDRWGVHRRQETPARLPGNPVLRADQPWETHAASPTH